VHQNDWLPRTPELVLELYAIDLCPIHVLHERLHKEAHTDGHISGKDGTSLSVACADTSPTMRSAPEGLAEIIAIEARF
jgi:hypothetical protein